MKEKAGQTPTGFCVFRIIRIRLAHPQIWDAVFEHPLIIRGEKVLIENHLTESIMLDRLVIVFSISKRQCIRIASASQQVYRSAFNSKMNVEPFSGPSDSAHIEPP